MAFVRVNKSAHGGAHIEENSIRMGAHMQSEKGTTRSVYVSISQSVIDQVGWKKITSPEAGTNRIFCNVDVQEGVGEDAGYLLLAPSDKGYSCGTTTKHAKSFSMSISVTKLLHYVPNAVPVPASPVEFTVDEKDHTILIMAPDWLRYNSLSYTEPKLEQPKPKEDRKSPNPPKVTDLRVVVEPTPGHNRRDRRALAQALTKSLHR